MVVDNNQTQSVWRSAGQNSITFEDSKGSEDILINATKDMHVTVGNDEQTKVGNDQTVHVGSNAALTVDKDQTVASMQHIADILAKEHGQLWINHDAPQSASQKKAPEFYE